MSFSVSHERYPGLRSFSLFLPLACSDSEALHHASTQNILRTHLSARLVMNYCSLLVVGPVGELPSPGRTF